MGRLQGGEIIIIINTWEHGSALQRTKGSPVYPGGHLQMARLPGGGHVSSITDQDQILGELLRCKVTKYGSRVKLVFISRTGAWSPLVRPSVGQLNRQIRNKLGLVK